MLKELLSARLSDKTLFTSKFKNRKGELKSLESIRSDILNGINKILSCIQTDNPGFGLKIDFSTSGKGHRFNGMFKNEGLVGMLEGGDHRSLDQVMPFVAIFVDLLCGDGSELTEVFLWYCEVQKLIYREKLLTSAGALLK